MDTQLLIFDLDGTLVDSRADLAAGINHMRGHFGLAPLDLATISTYVGNGVRKLVERSLQGAAVDFDEALQVNTGYYFSHLTVHTQCYSGVVEGIRALSAAGHRLALLTNKPGDPSREIMKYFGLASFFDIILGGGDLERLKPEPDGIFHAMQAVGVDAERVWMVGDHYTDLSAAQNAKVKSAFVRYGFGEKRGFKPTVSFDSFAELTVYFGE